MRKATNKNLQQAKKSKSDEFYTLLPDIERELQHYRNQFQNKTVYCNCDDPNSSNFFRYFIDNFHSLGLKKLIASCYQENKRDLFSAPNEGEHGIYCVYTGETDISGRPTIPDYLPFDGDGDFRSKESIDLLIQSDIVVTNPPFSLFREYMAQLVKFKKKFLIIGTVNAITYREIFDLIQKNEVWLGVNLGRGISGFLVPNHYDLYGTEICTDNKGNAIVSTNNCLWLTNLELERRHEYIKLTKVYNGNEQAYPAYDNCNGINVNRTKDIPKDYNGLMGVPITFLHKYNPDQFEIVRFRKGEDGKDLRINGKCPYFRILIKNKRTASA